LREERLNSSWSVKNATMMPQMIRGGLSVWSGNDHETMVQMETDRTSFMAGATVVRYPAGDPKGVP